MPETIEWFITDRQQGKTQALLDWVKQGHKTMTYPFWDRVILVSSLQEAQNLRGVLVREANSLDGLEYNQVYSYDEWKNAHIGMGPVTLGIDNVEHFLNRILFPNNNRIGMITGTGKVVSGKHTKHSGHPSRLLLGPEEVRPEQDEVGGTEPGVG